MLLHHLKLKKVLYYLIVIGFYQAQAMQEPVQCDEQQQVRHEVSPLSSSLSFFEQRDIHLPLGCSDIIPLTFDQPKGRFISNYLLDGMLIGRLTTTDSVMRFKACGEQLHNFSLTNPLQINLLEISSGGKFTFQKPVSVKTASLGCKSLTFLDKFLSEQNLFVDTDCCDMYGDVSCLNFLCKSNYFNAMPGSSLTVEEMAHFPCLESLFNDGQISIGKDAIVNTISLENYGDLRIGSLDVTSKNILNTGSVDITDSFVVASDSINNQGRWKIGQDCFFKQVGLLSTSQKSQWRVGRDWKAHVDKLFLEGRSSVGNLTLFDVGSSATLSGPFQSYIFHLDSKGLIWCTPQAEFFVNHHLGLKANGWIEYEGDTLEKALSKNKQQPPLAEADPLLELFPQGIFLHSIQSGIKKSGTLVARNGSVSLAAKKFITISGLTEAGFNLHAMLAINAASLICKKDSLLQAFAAQLTAQDLIEQHGKALIDQQLLMDASKVINTGSLGVGTALAVKGNEILAEESSAMHAKSIALEAQEVVDQKGTIASENFLTQAPDINFHGTSKVTSDKVQLQAQKTINHKGTIDSDSCATRAQVIDNSGDINSQTMKINADRWWWNSGNVMAQEALTMDALAAFNIFGTMRVKKLTSRVGLDVNFLGLYQAQNSDVNALIGIQAGLYLPQISSWDDIVTQNNVMGLGETLAMTVVPTWARLTWKGGKTLYKLPNMYEKTSCLYQQAQLLHRQKDAGISDWIPLLCETKDLIFSSMQVVRTGVETYKGIPLAIQDFQHSIENSVNNSKKAELEIWRKSSNFIDTFDPLSRETLLRINHGASLIAAYGPSCNRSTLLDFDAGVNLGVNGQSTSLWSMHSGVSAFTNNYTIDTCQGQNFGVLAVNNLTTHATHDYFSSGLLPFAGFYGVSSNISGENLDIDGNIYMIDRASLQARNNARIGVNIDAGNVSVQASEAVDLVNNCHIDTHNGPVNVVAKKITSDAVVNSQENINMQGTEIALRKSSHLTSKTGAVKLIKAEIISKEGIVSIIGAEDISNAGRIDSQKFLTRAKFIKHSGILNSQDAHILGDRYFWNTGTADIKRKLIIDALVCINSINSENACNANSWSWNTWNPWDAHNGTELGENKFGFVKAHDLTIRSGVNMNLLGCYQSQEGSINSFLDVNAGAYLPQFDSWNDLCTERNMWMAGDYVASFFVPQLVMKSGKFAWKAPGMLEKFGSFDEQIKKIREMKDSEACDWIPFLLDVKDVGMFAKQGYDIGVEGWEAIPSEQDRQKHIDKFADNFENFRNNPEQLDFLQQTIYEFAVQQFKASQANEAYQKNPEELNFVQQKMVELQKVASDYVDSFDPSVRRNLLYANRGRSLLGTLYGSNLHKNSLLDFDAGLNLGMNGVSTSIWSMHSGISGFTNNYTIDTRNGVNFGALAASNLTVNATHDYASYGLLPFAGLYGISNSVTAENLDIYGSVYAFDRSSCIARNKARIGADVTSNMDRTYIKAKTLDNTDAVIHGGLALNVAEQPVNIGTIDGQGKGLQYEGPLDNNFADELARGHGEHLQSSHLSSVVIVGGQQDVHFTEEHAMQHTLQTITDKSITADKPIKSEGSIILDGKGDVTHKSLKAADNIGVTGDNVTAKSTTQRVVDGNNYNDTLDQVSIEAGGGVRIHGNGNVNHAAIHTKSGSDGTKVTANGNVIDAAVLLESQTQAHTKDHIKKDNVQTDTKTTSINMAVSRHQSQGDYEAHANEEYVGVAPQFDTKGVSTIGVHGTKHLQAHNATVSISDQTTNGGRIFEHSEIKRTEIQSSSSFGTNFNTKEKPVISAPQGAVTINGISGVAPIIQSRDPVNIGLNQTVSDSFIHKKGSNALFNSEKVRERGDHEYRPLQTNGKIEIDAPVVNIQVIKGQVFDVLEKISMHGDGVINQTLVEDFHFKHNESTITLTPEATIVLALAVTAASAGLASGAGAGLVAAAGIKSAIVGTVVQNMTAASITAFNIQAAQAILECQGDFGLAAKRIASTETLKQVAIAAATAGLTSGLNQGLDKFGLPDVKKADTLLQRFEYVAPREFSRAALLTVIAACSGQDIQSSAMQNLRQATAGTLGIACASQIGNDYGQGNMHPVTHKLLHTGVGGITGAIVNGKDGAIAGATGALIAETIADAFAPERPTYEAIVDLQAQKGSPLTDKEFIHYWNHQNAEYMQHVSNAATAGKMTATVAALLARQDISTANFTATTAVDNNFLVLAAAGLIAADVAYTAYNIYNAFEQGGFDAGLKQLGIEVICYGAGCAVGHVAGTVAYKVGSVVYPTVEAALHVAVDKTPGLKVALGSCFNEFIVLGEKYNKTTLAKGIARAEGTILNTQAQVFGGVAKAKDKVVDKAVQAKNKMLQQLSSNGHTQPGSILVPQKPGVQVLLSAQEIAELERVLGRNALPASSSINQLLLQRDLAALEISGGHALEKHVVEQGEFSGWIRTRAQLKQHIENVIDNPTLYKNNACKKDVIEACKKHGIIYCEKEPSKHIYYHELSNTLIVNNQHAPDGGTVFQPKIGAKEFYKQN